MSNDASPPAYDTITVLYDETHHGKHYSLPRVDSIGNLTNLMGRLPKYAETTDGSFSICIAGGNCTLVSKSLYESIPQEHRPALNTNHAGRVETFLGSIPAVGSTIMPITLVDAETGQRFCIKLYALVAEGLVTAMFIGKSGIDFIDSEGYGPDGEVKWGMDFGNGRTTKLAHRINRAN